MNRLSTLAGGAILVACLAGALALGGWYLTERSWQRHLQSAYAAGVSLYEAARAFDRGPLSEGTDPPDRFEIALVRPEVFVSDDGRERLRFPGVPPNWNQISLSLLADPARRIGGDRIRLRVAGPVRLQALSRIGTDGQGPTAHFAALVQTLARYCGPHILLFDRGDGSWLRIEADAIWSCDARPPDIRVPATLGGALVAFIAWSVLSARAGALATLGERIDSRVRGGGVAPVPESGPDEAVLIARAVNRFLEAERDRLEARADLLSTVSHDLGTPAARLKLRAALIEDPELRARFDRDIGLMTSMIDGVLAFTRNELDPEEPRRVSLLALVQAVVDDFADTGAPVTMRPFAPAEAGGASTVFGHGSRVRIDEPMRVLCLCRPAQITRALTNLVDNAVKYGQSAEISLTASAAEATIAIRDSGISRGEEELGALVGPFRRGLASEGKPGAGLGLSIVARIVQSHGGRLEFDRSGSGWIVRMTIPRGGHG